MITAFYLPCLTRQSKTRLESLSNETGLLIPDYCQKVLPMALREGQCNYFGKK